MTSIAITPKESKFAKRCEQLANQFHLPLFKADMQSDYLLQLGDSGFTLLRNQAKKSLIFYLDFVKGKIAMRTKNPNAELLKKAIGLNKHFVSTVLDCTAGFGTDGFLLANLGCAVTMLEKNSIIYLLLQDALKRFFIVHPNHGLQIEIYHQCSKEFLQKVNSKSLDRIFDVIYLDPMFPPRHKSAAVKKSMQFLQDICEKPNLSTAQEQQWLTLSKMVAKQRVIIKRPRHAEYFAGQIPDFQYLAKTVRFDGYNANF